MAALSKLTGIIEAQFNFKAERWYTGLQPSASDNSFKKRMTFATGAAIALGANEVYCQVRTLAGGANEVLDLAGSGLTNPLGDSDITFARIKAIFVWLLAAADSIPDPAGNIAGTLATSIRFGGAGSNPAPLFFADASDMLVVPNGGMFLWSDPGINGLAVTATSADKLKVENLDGAVQAKYLLGLLGAAT